MKKILAMTLALALCLSLAACGSTPPAAETAPATEATPVPTEAETAPAAEGAVVSNFAELKAALEGEETLITLENFDTTGETTTYLEISRPLTLDGNGASIDFGFEVLTCGVTIKNFNISTHTWEQAVSKNDKNGTKTGGDCICIEIHNDASGDPVVVENVTIEHDVFDNNNSAIYIADGSYVHILNNNITVLNEQGNTRERGGIYIGSNTSGKIIGNTIDSARTAMPMSPVGLTANLDAMTEAVEMPAMEISGNTATAIYITKMYTNGELFGEDGLIKEDDTDFEVREALEAFLVALAENNTFTNKEGTLGEGENVFVASRLDLIYAGVSMKDASVYFDVADGHLVAGVAK